MGLSDPQRHSFQFSPSRRHDGRQPRPAPQAALHAESPGSQPPGGGSARGRQHVSGDTPTPPPPIHTAASTRHRRGSARMCEPSRTEPNRAGGTRDTREAGTGAPARDPSHPTRGGGGRGHSPSPALGGTAGDGDGDGGSASVPRRRLGHTPHAFRAAARPAARSPASAAAAASPPWRGKAAEGGDEAGGDDGGRGPGPRRLRARSRLSVSAALPAASLPEPALAVRRLLIGRSETSPDWPTRKGRHPGPSRAPPLRAASERSLAHSLVPSRSGRGAWPPRSCCLTRPGPIAALSAGKGSPPGSTRHPCTYAFLLSTVPAPLDVDLLPSLQMRTLRPNTSYTAVRRQGGDWNSNVIIPPLSPNVFHLVFILFCFVSNCCKVFKRRRLSLERERTCKAPRTGLAPWVSSYIRSGFPDCRTWGGVRGRRRITEAPDGWQVRHSPGCDARAASLGHTRTRTWTVAGRL
ncbi:uncharacterized protein [Saccopteryx leptura]|uniref:uncharacterized protein n=1 Tax=Saccopteryx leptura TaxID=249018 RepID=UPI00339D1FB2